MSDQPPNAKFTRREIQTLLHAMRLAVDDGSLYEGLNLEDEEVNREINSIRHKLRIMLATTRP